MPKYVILASKEIHRTKKKHKFITTKSVVINSNYK